MRLLHTKKLTFHNFYDSDIPDYAILSHRWEENEVTYLEYEIGSNRNGTGFAKVTNLCALAGRAGYEWTWIDTCCIDKSSSAELSEAINSMFRWYKRAGICYAYLSDYTHQGEDGNRVDDKGSGFRGSSWFSRGWTLQELLAPTDVLFLDGSWRVVGKRHDLAEDISVATGISTALLCSPDWAKEASVAMKMSWACRRQTSRIEDMAYCLMGLFGVNMPLLYGEGRSAFMRLQLEIIKISNDESIFAWTSHRTCSGLLADWPDAFSESGKITPGVFSFFEDRPPYMMTNQGLELRVPPHILEDTDVISIPLNCKEGEKTTALALSLYKPTGRPWYRICCSSLTEAAAHRVWSHQKLSAWVTKTIYVAQYDVPEDMNIANDRKQEQARRAQLRQYAEGNNPIVKYILKHIHGIATMSDVVYGPSSANSQSS